MNCSILLLMKYSHWWPKLFLGEIQMRLSKRIIKNLFAIKMTSKYLLVCYYYLNTDQNFYWSADENFDCSLVREAIYKNRYKDNKETKNSDTPINCSDKCYKIRSLIDLRNKTSWSFLLIIYVIDEKLVEYFGRHSLKQFIERRPIRFRFKERAMVTHSNFQSINGKIQRWTTRTGI